MASSKPQRTSARKMFNMACRVFNDETAQDVINQAVLPELKDDIKSSYKLLVDVSLLYQSSIEDEKSEDFAKASSYIVEIDEQYAKAISMFSKFYKPPSAISAADSTTTGSRNEPVVRSNSKVKCKTIEPTIFTGDIREYPAWKKRFQKKFQSQYGDQAGVVLKEIVKGDAAKIIRSVDDDDIEGIFSKLDKQYGDPQNLVDSILEEIQHIPQCYDDDADSIRLLYDKVSLARSDLKFVSMESELEHFSTVRIIEQRLPPSLQKDWAKQKLTQKITKASELFEPLMLFLENAVKCAEDVAKMKSDSKSSSCASPCYTVNLSDQSEVPDSILSAAARPTYKPTLSISNTSVGKVTNLNGNITNPSAPTHPDPRFCTYHKSSGHWPRGCRTFQNKSTEDKVRWFENDGKEVCRICLSNDHGTDGSQCPLLDKFPNCSKCDKKHHSAYHEALDIIRQKEKPANPVYVVQTHHTPSFHTENLNLEVNYKCSISPALTGHMPLLSKNVLDMGILLDPGSVITLISMRIVKMANLIKLCEQPYTIVMETVGGDMRQIEAYAYKIPLLKHDSSVILYIQGYGVETIGSKFQQVDTTKVTTEFGLDPSDFQYPSNMPLDLLIGTDNARLCHPVPIQVNKAITTVVFGKTDIGNVVFGSHHSFKGQNNTGHYRATSYAYKRCDMSEFFSTETMGVECHPRCGACRCGRCAPGGGILTIKEEYEYRLIKEGMKLINSVVIANYPLIKDPSSLPDHLEYAMARLIQFENRLLKPENHKILEMFRVYFLQMIESGIYRLLTDEEDKKWRENPKNLVHYLPYREVLKLSSLSTPLRIILDPASSPDGVSINDFWAVGPKLVINPFGLQLRHREEPVAISNDINKMYNEVRTTELVYHCHRILHRDFDQTKEPDTYVVVRNSFGSRPAGAVAITALHIVAEAGQNQFPLGARVIKEQTFVDDIMDSVTDRATADQTMSQTENCLALGSFTLKNWTIVDSRNLEQSVILDKSETRQIGGSPETVLGVHWELSTDSFKFVPKINFSKKKRNIRVGPNLQVDEIFSSVQTLTLRNILSQVNGFYDPMGLVAPYITQVKFALAKLWKVMRELAPNAKELWDIPIPSDCDEEWKRLLNAAFHIGDVKFPRVLRPENHVGNPWLVMMSDSSMLAFGACAFVRWELSDGSHWCRLITAKSRIWPVDPNDFISLCRGELQGVVLAKRLAVTIIEESRFTFERIIFLMDSEIVRAQISKDSHAFDIFVGHRVGEIRSKFSPEQFYHIKGQLNSSADLLSRGTISPEKLDENSSWQRGPSFLYEDFDKWEISQTYSSVKPLPELRDFSYNQKTMLVQTGADIVKSDVLTEPYGDCTWTEALSAWNAYLVKADDKQRIVTTRFSDEAEVKIAKRFDLSRYSSLNKLLAATFRVLYILSWKPGDGHFLKFAANLKVVNADQLDQALEFWLRSAQRCLVKDIKNGKYQSLKPVLDEKSGIWRLNGRFGNHVDGYHPIILPGDHPFIRILVTAIHDRSHCGATATAAKVKNDYHVLGIKRMARDIRKNCTECRIIAKDLVKVPMAPYPLERFRPAYAFENCSCDLFGHFLLQVPGRVTRGRPMDYYGRGYGLILTCLSTRAIHLEAMEGQDTSAFLISFRRFISIRGQPRFVWSDNGGQIVASAQELIDVVKGWDDTKIRKFGAENGIRFEYSAPIAPWQNGVSEALIRSVKNSFLQTVRSAKPRMPIMHLQLLMYETAAILNERPINLGHSEVPGNWDSETNLYLCPNQLLLGRSSVRIQSGPFSVAISKHAELFHELEKIVNNWWKNWNEHYIPTLLRQSKWHTESRSVCVGDIVYVKDANAIRSEWKIAEICKILDSNDGKARNVELRYKVLPAQPFDKYSGVPDMLEIRDAKTLFVLLTAEERKLAKS